MSMREHGTPARYRRGPDENDQPGKGCRCPRCRKANNADVQAWRKRKAREAWGAPPVMVDAEPIRTHVRSLMAAGVGWERIADLAGVSRSTVRNLLCGEPRRGHTPTRHLRRQTAEKLAVLTVEQALADGARVDAAGTRRRLQALVAVGWPKTVLARRLGRAPQNMPFLPNWPHTTVATVRAVKALYDELWDQPPPRTTNAERRAATWARRRAAAAGWLPPAAWDDDLIDLPDEDLAAELNRRAAAMDDDELCRCNTARRAGDNTPLVVAGALEYRRRQRAQRTAAA